MDALSIINIANPYESIKIGTSSPASIWNTCVCRPPSGQYNDKSSGHSRGFFSASTVEHEATRRRPADKTALQGLITVELNWRARLTLKIVYHLGLWFKFILQGEQLA